MQKKWFSECDGDEEVAELKADILAARRVLERLSRIAEEKSSATLNVTEHDYDSPSWSHKQAHGNGYRQAMREIQMYLDTTES